jgi:hypothetical protein
MSLGHSVRVRPGALEVEVGGLGNPAREFAVMVALTVGCNGFLVQRTRGTEGNSFAVERVHRHLTLHGDQQVVSSVRFHAVEAHFSSVP